MHISYTNVLPLLSVVSCSSQKWCVQSPEGRSPHGPCGLPKALPWENVVALWKYVGKVGKNKWRELCKWKEISGTREITNTNQAWKNLEEKFEKNHRHCLLKGLSYECGKEKLACGLMYPRNYITLNVAQFQGTLALKHCTLAIQLVFSTPILLCFPEGNCALLTLKI